MKELVRVADLKSYFFLDNAVIKAADGIDLVVQRGEILGIVGESGAGKSVTALSIIKERSGLYREPQHRELHVQSDVAGHGCHRG